MGKFNLVREVGELKSQLSYSKRFSFFFGAGTSCALGIPNILALTNCVEEKLEGNNVEVFKKVKDELATTFPKKVINIEDILNHLRQIRAITGEREDKKYMDVSGHLAAELDKDLCRKIYSILSDKEKDVDKSITKKFFAWLNMQKNDYSKEIFTSNYDLVIEKSLEEIGAPYFDGFVGSYEPFFWQESIERFVERSDLTQSWIRLWKIYGSLNWFWKGSITGSHSIIRGGKILDVETVENELVIYPSREKYDSSKKQPFVAYFDRLKNVLLSGELLFVVTGYSFSDQHINEIIFNALRQNNRLSVLVFFYQDSEVEELFKSSAPYLNLTAFGPTKAIVNGTLGDLEYVESDLKSSDSSSTYWDKDDNKLLLGDFKKLVDFLIVNSGKKDNIEEIANAK